MVDADWTSDRGQAVAVGQVIWGERLLIVDRLACDVGGETLPDCVADCVVAIEAVIQWAQVCLGAGLKVLC